jgi:hypothetical protein
MKRYASYNEINLRLEDNFSDAFTDNLIPDNSYIDKSKTGLGITFSEFHAKRHSIMVIPSLQIIDDKINQYKETKPLKIAKETSEDKIVTHIQLGLEHNKLITTPESFYKIINAFETLNMLEVLYSDYFCFLDEVHCYATDRFRNEILTPFKWFWSFKNKAVGTATAYDFSDERFNSLNYYKIRFDKPFGLVQILRHDITMFALVHLIRHKRFDGNVHIFFNSVKEIARAITILELGNVSIYCRKEERNMNALAEKKEDWHIAPTPQNMKRYNFYSCRYNEGWDLYDDEKATIILVTDLKIKHTALSIQYKGFQAIGRLRSKEIIDGRRPYIQPNAIYHITNTLDTTQFKSFKAVKRSWFFEADESIAYYNQHSYNCKVNDVEDKKLTTELISTVGVTYGGVARVYPMKVDQRICEEFYAQFYANIEYVEQAWKSVNYLTLAKEFNVQISKTIKNKSEMNREVVQVWERFRLNKNCYFEGVAERTVLQLKKRFHNLHSSYTGLGVEKLEELGYDDDAMMKARADLNNTNVTSMIKDQLLKCFILGSTYTRNEIKQKLNELYNDNDYLTKNLKRQKANAEHLQKWFGFTFREATKKLVDGKKMPAVKITSVPSEGH